MNGLETDSGAVLLVGAGVRAAAWSTVRAGWRPFAIDLFGDRDLRAIATSRRVPAGDYPTGLLVSAREFPAVPLIYTGALENHPGLVDRLARGRRLLGNPAEVLRRLRDPIGLARFWRSRETPAPEATLDPDAIPRDGSWLAKPIRSASGRGIRRWRGEGPTRGHYFQRRLDGQAGSALYRVDPGDPTRSKFLGATYQLLDGFRYVGSVGPWRMGGPLADRVARLGELVAREYRPVGLFGIDFIERDGVPWPVEVNPRYTASVEVLELSHGRSSWVDDHWDSIPTRLIGKRIVPAVRDCRFPDVDRFAWVPPDPWEVPDAADLPHPGERFHAGEPVLTVLAAGDSIDSVRDVLRMRHEDWLARLDRSV